MVELHFLLLEQILIIHLAEAQTTYGLIGIKVWICRGEVYGKRDLMLHFKTPRKGGGDNNKEEENS